MSTNKEEEHQIVCTQDFLRQYYVSESVSIQFGLNNKTIRTINEEEFNNAAMCIMTRTNYPESTLKRSASTYLLNSYHKKPATLSLPFVFGDTINLSEDMEDNNENNLLYSDTLYGDDSLTQRGDQVVYKIDTQEEDSSFTLLQSEANETRPLSSSSTPQILQSDYSVVMQEGQTSNGSIFQFSSP
ncbi:hypothetical protein GRS66_010845 [Saccharomyces pastorianus]|uniref:Meiotic recombination protein REC104 n=2 Tax=Saccharomyces pastorianus TaxID=27292 RepID=RE104_SACPS|nr:RecName: Full=Meiotic recombination protein REC104 [Saccharomyces pastorianus]AAB41529.1 Rec104p [Saccharomyces pastorianus]QID88138.1 hypothetical protein GRS66_010845 [Saccharomyces pastorianus]